MQSLWSRAAQTRSCRCRACLHVATNVARRATTAASKRRLRVSDIFTACYSTILATAAVADAKVKEDRRREWDIAIAEARGTTQWSDSEASIQARGEPSIEITHGSPTVLGQSAPEVKTWKPMWDDQAPQSFGNFETRLKVLDEKIRQSLEDPSEASGFGGDPPLQQLHEASELEWIDEEPDQLLYERDPTRPIHLERRELSCASLVEQLLVKLVGSVQKRAQGASSPGSHPELKDIVLHIQTLRSGYTKLPTYVWEDLAVIDHERRALHRSILDICGQATPQDVPSLELMIAKICYQLLVCTTPFSMVTYNILVSELGRLRQYDLAQVIVDSFLYETRLKPNHNTLRIFLDHYLGKNDAKGWRAIRDRMRVTPAGDMRVKRRHKNELDVPPVQDWIFDNIGNLKWSKKTRFLSQMAPRDSNVFDSLIRGALEFNGPRNAVLQIKRTLERGQMLYSDTLCAVMKALVDQRDERGSTTLMYQILSLWDDDADQSAIVFTRAVRALIYQLMSIIGIDPSLGSTATPPHHLPLAKLQAMLRQLRIFSIEDSIARAEKFVSTIEDHLEDMYYSRSSPENDMQSSETGVPCSTVETGLIPAQKPKNLKWFARENRTKSRNLRQNKHYGRQIRLGVLEKSLEYNAEKIEGLTLQVLPFAFKALPGYQRSRYLDMTSRIRFHGNKRPSRYDLLTRVRREGVMGLLSYVEKQLLIHERTLAEIDADVFSMRTSVAKIRDWEIEPYLEKAAGELLAGAKKAADLEERVNRLRQQQALPLSADGQTCKTLVHSAAASMVAISQQETTTRSENVRKQLWKLEREAERLGNHIDKLNRMYENLSDRLRALVIYSIEIALNDSTRVLSKSALQLDSLKERQESGSTQLSTAQKLEARTNEKIAVASLSISRENSQRSPELALRPQIPPALSLPMTLTEVPAVDSVNEEVNATTLVAKAAM